MNKLKMLLGSSVSTLALVLGLTVPAGAAQTCTVEDVTLGVAGCLQVDTTNNDDSPTNGSGNQANNGGTVVDGNCNINNTVNAGGSAVGGSGGAGGAGVGTGVGGVLSSGTGTGNGGAGGAGGSASTTINNNVSADCSTSNVTNVTQAAADVEDEDQVSVAPKGGVHAGFGSTSTSTSVAALVGLTGSLGVLGAGLRALKGEL